MTPNPRPAATRRDAAAGFSGGFSRNFPRRARIFCDFPPPATRIFAVRSLANKWCVTKPPFATH